MAGARHRTLPDYAAPSAPHGALLGTAGLHSMKHFVLALLLVSFRLWIAASVWNQLWDFTLLAIPERSWAKHGKRDTSQFT
jgi:hypothetical protein